MLSKKEFLELYRSASEDVKEQCYEIMGAAKPIRMLLKYQDAGVYADNLSVIEQVIKYDIFGKERPASEMMSYDQLSTCMDIFVAGYIAGIRAERSKKRKV